MRIKKIARERRGGKNQKPMATITTPTPPTTIIATQQVKKNHVPLRQAGYKIAAGLAVGEGGDAEPAGAAVLAGALVAGDGVLDDLAAAGGGLHLGGGAQVADQGDLGDVAAGGGREGGALLPRDPGEGAVAAGGGGGGGGGECATGEVRHFCFSVSYLLYLLVFFPFLVVSVRSSPLRWVICRYTSASYVRFIFGCVAKVPREIRRRFSLVGRRVD